ncbi:MAG: hypothetical protein ABIH11_08945 [Candidatus Altiarchaeota archaeon]
MFRCLVILALFCGCVGTNVNQAGVTTMETSVHTPTTTIPRVMDYHGLYVFNCESSDDYPVKTTFNTTTIYSGEGDRTVVMMKSEFNYCTFANNNIILWDIEQDDCLPRGTSQLTYYGAKPFAVTGFFNGSVSDGYDEFRKFYVTDVPGHSYICCNVCCNINSPVYSRQKKCFWFDEDKAEMLPDDYILKNSFAGDGTIPPASILVIPPVINQPSGDFDCEELHGEIEGDLDNANYCQVDSDCGVIMLGGWYVDFGCYHFISREVDKEQFYAKMDAYKQKCSNIINDCSPAPEAKCVSSKCVYAEW